MQVEITLFEENNKGPAMWFLGVPPNPKIALNFNAPGPVQVDFDELSEEEKRHILVSINMRRIRSSVSYSDLLKNYAAESEVPEIEKLAKEGEARQQMRSVEDENAAKRVERQHRCVSLIALGVKSLRVEVAKLNVDDQEELSVLKTLKLLELGKPKRKQRTSILEAIDEKLHLYNVGVITELEKSAGSTKVVDPFRPYDKLEVQYGVQVEESDQEIVRFVTSDPMKVKDPKSKKK